MTRLRALVCYLRLEQDGGLNLALLLLLVATIIAKLPGFALGLVALHFERYLNHARAMKAMASAEALALAKRSDDAEKLEKKIDELDKRVKELATPERLEATRKLLAQMKAAVPGFGRP